MDDLDINQYLEDIDVMTEAYYGKLPEFIAIEKLFDIITQKAHSEGIRTSNPNKYPELRKVEAIFRKVFGFKKVCIYFEPYASPNAYTYSMNILLFYSKKKEQVEKTSHGFYDNSKSTSLGVFLSTGLFEIGLTSKELIACILHEIGHNFDYSVYHRIEHIINNILTLGAEEVYVRQHKDEVDELRDTYGGEVIMNDDKIFNNPKRRKRMGDKYDKYQKQKLTTLGVILGYLSIPFAGMVDILAAIASTPLLFSVIGGKKGELFADSFATAYGYGSDLVTALEKLEHCRDRYGIPKSGPRKLLADLAQFQNELLVALVDVHGSNMERCKECIEKLKWDLDHNDFQPELRAELIKEIETLTEQYKKFYTFEPQERFKVTKIARKVANVICGGRPNLIKLFKRNKV